MTYLWQHMLILIHTHNCLVFQSSGDVSTVPAARGSPLPLPRAPPPATSTRPHPNRPPDTKEYHYNHDEPHGRPHIPWPVRPPV